MTSPAAATPRPRPAVDLVLVAGIAIYIGIRALHLLRWDLWFDELFGIGLGYLGWGQLLARAVADQTNPPLFYLLLKGWMGLGAVGPFKLRLLPFLIGVAELSPILRLLRLLRLPRGTRLTVLLLAAVSPLLVFYAVEIRAYTLVSLLTTAAMAETWLLAGAGKLDRGAAVRLAVLNILLPLTHYYGWFTIAAEVGALLWWRRDRWPIAAVIVAPAILAFAPWAAAVVAVAHASHTVAPTIRWIARPNLASLDDFPIFLLTELHTDLDVVALPILLLGTGMALWAARRAPERPTAAHFSALFLAAPVACGFFGSLLLPRSIWGPRYLIGAAIPALILIALGLARLPRAPRIVATLFVAGLGAVGLYRADEAKLPWSRFVAALAAPGSHAPVYVFEAFTALPIRYYDGLEDRHLVIKPVETLAELEDSAGWVVARDSSWPGGTAGSAALLGSGLALDDSLRMGIPGEWITAWRWHRPPRLTPAGGPAGRPASAGRR